ncbi:extracellular solute-binding protein [Gracilibacillus timonensis]|uniref:extracellular solute-binding protein n=1 Tax=Gracilibacillus timonensis TaxID=1816696 RepID=UPI0008248EFF|nr:extracellular solute-binding protein [Gracilibacillus timonensis]
MRKKSKYIMISIFVIISMLIAGCSSNDSSGSSDKNGSATIRAIFPSGAGTEEALESIAKEFEEDNPNTTVELEFIAYNSLKQKILTSAQAGSYDVTYVDQPWLAQFANSGIIEEMPEELSSDEQEDIFDNFIDGMTFNEGIYAMPWKNDTKFLFYNKQILSEAGFDNPPTTWEELQQQSEEIKSQGLVEYPIVWSWSQSEALVCDFVTLVGGYGGEIMHNDQPNFEGDNIFSATSFMVDSLETGISNPNSTEYIEQDVLDNFTNGNSAFAINWSFMYSEAKNSDVGEQLGVTVVPGSDDVESASVYGGEGLGVTSGSENKEAAWKFIKYITSKEVQKEHAEVTLPIWESLYEDTEILEQNPELVEVANKQFKNMISRPKIPSYGELSQNIQVELQGILTGTKTIDSGLTDLQSEVAEE